MVAIRIEVLAHDGRWKGPFCVIELIRGLDDHPEWREIWRAVEPTPCGRFGDTSKVRHYFTPLGWNMYGQRAFNIAKEYLGDRVRKVMKTATEDICYKDAHQCAFFVS